ncbi:MAG: hypothetical protein JNK54_01600 [Elusimicrobia bacterium]|jgi:hypothetical protein|nr:hypothetical protein [Elusimicrobiota bacterium]
MSLPKKYFPILVGVGIFFAGCLGPVPRRGTPPSRPPGAVPPPVSDEVILTPEETVEPGVEIPVISEGRGRGVAVWVPGVRTDPLASARYLSQRPWMRVTAVFPERFLGDDENSRQARALFHELISLKQVELVLTLPDRPVLPLILDMQNALLSSPTVAALPAAFARPSDVVDQVGLARESFRRRWKVSPAGMELPWGVALGPEFPLLRKLKIEWGLLPSSGTTPAVIEEFKIPVVRPAAFPSRTLERKVWFAEHAQETLLSSGTVGPLQVESIEDLENVETLAEGPVVWVLLSEFLKEGVPETVDRVFPDPVDFTPWVGDAEENRAWDLLGITRLAVDGYQNSGTADLKTLDLAKRAIHSAENGDYFFRLGAERNVDRGNDVVRDFTATLAQVFQIIGVPVPPEIRGGFTGQGIVPADGDEPDGVFEREGDVLRWRDATNDDRGPGDYFYPTGAQFPTGAWDIVSFDVYPRNETVTFTFTFTALPNPSEAPAGFSLPLVDLYIDINHSVGAGSQEFLPGRPGMAEALDAWEYALSVDGWGARFFQHVSRRGAQPVAVFSAVKKTARSFSVTVPRRYFRGEPEAWGYAVVVMGRSSTGDPLPVGVEPGSAQFGGAVADHPAPPYIDLIVPEGSSQWRVLGAYKMGQDITLPFVRAE